MLWVVLGGLVGAAIGLFVGAGTGYTFATLAGVTGYETQAYFSFFVATPLCVLTGLASGAVLGAAWKGKHRKGFTIVGAGGFTLLLALVITDGVMTAPKRPAKVRVQNKTAFTLEHCFLGSDYRTNKRLGDIKPGETTAYRYIDLDKRPTFNRLGCRLHGKHVNLSYGGPLPNKDKHTLVVSGEADTLTLTRDLASR